MRDTRTILAIILGVVVAVVVVYFVASWFVLKDENPRSGLEPAYRLATLEAGHMPDYPAGIH